MAKKRKKKTPAQTRAEALKEMASLLEKQNRLAFDAQLLAQKYSELEDKIIAIETRSGFRRPTTP